MKNIQLIISYRGTRFAGWQIQPNGITIQEIVTKAIWDVTGEKVQLYASGRTDAGVHAIAQSANFHTKTTIPPEVFYKALNTRLPEDIRILSSHERSRDFHSRYNARGKSYLYKIYENPVASPFYADLAYHVTRQLDWKAMKEGAAHFVGEHDFAGFMATGSSVKTTIRTIEEISFDGNGEIREISFRGNGFLYNMVRIMAGTLYEVGCHRIKPEDIPGIIRSRERQKAGKTAPAHGLYLKEVYY
jgi:tRNA pseudouridine38-40 synthase